MWKSPNRRCCTRGPVEPVGQHGLSSFRHHLQIPRSSGKPKKTKRKASSWKRPGERQSLRWLLGAGPTCFPYLQVLRQKSAKLTFSVAALKRNFEKTPESPITSYLTYDALISMSPENQIQGIVPTIHKTYNFNKIVQLHKEIQSKLSPSHKGKKSHFVPCYCNFCPLSFSCHARPKK